MQQREECGGDGGHARGVEHCSLRAFERGGVVTLENDEVVLRYDLERGTISVEEADGGGEIYAG